MGFEDSITAIAEIAVTLAGFSGLVVVFGFKELSLSVALSRIIWVFSMCFVVVVVAFLPFVLADYTTRNDVIWGLPISLIGAFLLFFSGEHLLGRVHRTSRAFPITTTIVLSGGGLIGIWLVLVAFGVVHNQSPGTLLLGQLWLTTNAAYMFLTTLLALRKGIDEEIS